MPARSYRVETGDYAAGGEFVTIRDSASGRLIWSKTRSLTDDEIVSTVLDSHRMPRFSVHRPREAVARSTSKSSPPWPRYLVIRSSTLPGDQYIPIIDAPQLTRDKTVQDDDTSLEFALSIPPRRPRTLKSLRPSPLQLASHSMVSLNDEEEQDPLTPTQATHSVTPKKKPRPKSTSYRVDMTPSLSHDSQDSVASTSTSISTTSSTSTSTLDSTDPVSDPSGDLPRRVESPLPLESEIATFRLQPFVPQVSGEGASSRSFGGRIWHRMRSLVVEDGQKWSCVSVRDGEGAMPDSNDPETQTIMSYEEDQPTLFPSASKGTLTLSKDLVDESGYEPSFWIAVAIGWMEILEEREGWREGRGGD